MTAPNDKSSVRRWRLYDFNYNWPGDKVFVEVEDHDALIAKKDAEIERLELVAKAAAFSIVEKFNTIAEKDAEIARLNESVIESDAKYWAEFNRHEETKAQIERLKAALEFYAKGKHWRLVAGYGENVIDRGKVAREALAEIEAGEKEA